MRFPQVEYSDGLQKRTQRQFGGLNHTAGAAETDLWDMRNLSSKDYPVLSVRERRQIVGKLDRPNGIFAHDGIVLVDGTSLYFRDKFICRVTDDKKVFAGIGNYIVVLPDKLWINTETEEHGSLGAAVEIDNPIIGDGKLYGEDAKMNMLQKPGVNWEDYFKAGDAVTISGCTVHESNNKTAIIREIDGERLYFYEYGFDGDGEDGTEGYTESGTIKVEREIPDMDFICENENRLWGCKGNEIYASKLGDIFNWNVFDGLSTDSYAVTVGSAGRFTGCVSYGSYAIFFKQDHIYKMYGSYPSQFQLMDSATLGMQPGSEASAAVAGERLYYLSRGGFVMYKGGIPQTVGTVFGTERLHYAAAGSDGLKYFVSAMDEAGNWKLYVYDSQYRVWHIEDEREAIGFAWHEDCLYMLAADGQIEIVSRLWKAPTEGYTEDKVKWMAEFADADAGRPESKGVNKLRLRIELEKGSRAEAFVMFDSDGEWISAGAMDGTEKQSYNLPIPLRRCDHYRIRLTGTGGARLYSMEKQFYLGDDGRTI